MTEALERLGYRVESTTDPCTAHQRATTGRYALIVTDLHMPDLCGTELLESIRRCRPEMPALLVSAFPDRRTIAIANDLGIPLLAKPFSSAVFVAAIAALLESCNAPGGRFDPDAKGRSS
ncbi:MAG: response regulator [Deltaproteobacteria bacterium]|nr:response regulator [Deltaproteobacteria bacterium]